uniref:Flocculation protein FLO11-like n=1 Tax=Cucumis melo TaxID=3656 RepID=A0A9I9DCU7_CUCME
MDSPSSNVGLSVRGHCIKSIPRHHPYRRIRCVKEIGDKTHPKSSPQQPVTAASALSFNSRLATQSSHMSTSIPQTTPFSRPTLSSPALRTTTSIETVQVASNSSNEEDNVVPSRLFHRKHVSSPRPSTMPTPSMAPLNRRRHIEYAIPNDNALNNSIVSTDAFPPLHVTINT